MPIGEGCDKSYCNRGNKFKNKRTKTSKYNDKSWRGNPNKAFGKRGGLREDIIMRDKFTCQQCGYTNPNGKGLVVDHIKDWRTEPSKQKQDELFRNKSNLQTLCDSCHNAKTGRTNKAPGR